jgi:hypothetical protein
MRVALLSYMVFGVVFGCGRRETATTIAPPAGSQPAASEVPFGSLDAIFAEIVRTDWQTEHQWEPPSPKPPPEFVSKVREDADFRRIDLDGDGADERIICLNYSPGQKPINQTFHVAQKTATGWMLVGTIQGEPQATTDRPHSGMQPIDATWYNGGFEYTTTRYEFQNGRYVAVASKR